MHDVLMKNQITYQTCNCVSPSSLSNTNRLSSCKCLLPSFSAHQTALQPAPAPAHTPLASSSHLQTKTRLHEPFRGIQYPELQDSQLNGAHTIFSSLVFSRFCRICSLRGHGKFAEVGLPRWNTNVTDGEVLPRASEIRISSCRFDWRPTSRSFTETTLQM